MYGMVHKAARDMAERRMGAEAWAALMADAGLSDEHFITAEQYPDAVTMGLVDAIGRRLGLDRDAALEAFGRHWIAYAGASAYGRVLAMAGDDLATFIDNLDRMHASIKSTMPRAAMPSFTLLASRGDGFDILYASERTGLTAFVRGILAAVAERFGETVDIADAPVPGGVSFTLTRRVAALARASCPAA